MKFSIFQLAYLAVVVPLGILSTRIKEIKTGKRIPSLYTDIEVSLNQNNNKMYYVVEKYTNTKKASFRKSFFCAKIIAPTNTILLPASLAGG